MTRKRQKMNDELCDELRMIQGVVLGLDSISEQSHGRPQTGAERRSGGYKRVAGKFEVLGTEGGGQITGTGKHIKIDLELSSVEK